MRAVVLVLMVLIGLLTYDIFQGKNGLAQYQKVSQEFAEAKAISMRLSARNDAVQRQIDDLKQGDLAVEELARTELGLIKPDETFYRVIDPTYNQ